MYFIDGGSQGPAAEDGFDASARGYVLRRADKISVRISGDAESAFQDGLWAESAELSGALAQPVLEVRGVPRHAMAEAACAVGQALAVATGACGGGQGGELLTQPSQVRAARGRAGFGQALKPSAGFIEALLG